MIKKNLSTLLEELHDGDPEGTKHARLTNCLQQAIRKGILKPGERLPTEVELVAATPFSLGTVQKALRSLADAGLVQRSPKLGTFVTQSRARIDEPWHFRFLDADRKTLLPVYPTVVSRSEIRQRGPWNDFVHGRIFRIDRLVNVNDEFRAYSRFFIDGVRFPTLKNARIESLHGANFRVLLDREIDEPIRRIYHRLVVGMPSTEIAWSIGVPAGTICTTVEIAAAVNSGDFIYYQELTVPPSDRRLELAIPSV